MTVKPFTPDDAAKHKQEATPEFVIEAFNHLLAKNYCDGRTIIKVGAAVDEIISRMIQSEPKFGEMKKSALEKIIHDNDYLEIEPIYRQNGWDVRYDKPAYNENYEGFYEFKRKSTNNFR